MKKALLALAVLIVLNIALFSAILVLGGEKTGNVLAPIPVDLPTPTPSEEHVHNYLERVVRVATCKINGIIYYECSCGDYTRKLPPPTDHTPIIHEEPIAPTCLTPGKTGSEICSECEMILKYNEDIPALGHDLQNDSCARCGATGADLTAIGYGDCGENIHWRLFADPEKDTRHHLELTGSGDLPDYSSGNAPWYQSGYVTSVSISEKITSIGRYAFYYTGITELTVPAGVTAIRASAFQGCINLQTLVLPKSIKEIEKNAFGDCTLLTITFEGTVDEWNAIYHTPDQPTGHCTVTCINGTIQCAI